MKYILFFLCSCALLITNAQSNFNDHLEKLCQSSSVDFEKEVVSILDKYLLENKSIDETSNSKYLDFVKYLVEFDQVHELVKLEDRLTIRDAFKSLGVYENNKIDYDPILKLLRQSNPKDSVIRDFMGVIREIKRNEYDVSSGLIADGILFSLNGSTLDRKDYKNIAICISAPFIFTKSTK